jgi:signal transduction histidine kinase
MKEADETLSILSSNGGEFPDMRPVSSMGAAPDDNPLFRHPREGMEKPFSTRYFTATFSKSGKLTEINTSKIAAISDTEAKSIAQNVYAKKSLSGITSDYKYTVIKGDETTYIFLDIAENLSTFYKFLFASIGISLIGILFFFILVYHLSKLVIQPMIESAEKQRQFITDASHELKTPLAIIRANNDVLTLEQGESEWTISTAHQIDRLNSLTEKLVFLSRMDEDNREQLQPADFNLSYALEDTLDAYESLEQTSHLKVNAEITPDILVHADEGMIRRCFSLLIDNAIKYTNEGGWIEIRLSGDKHPIFTIANSCEEIVPGDHSEFFDRFYRGDKSRNSKTGGFGIGLSVVYAILQAHGYTIEASSPDDKSIIFTIKF